MGEYHLIALDRPEEGRSLVFWRILSRRLSLVAGWGRRQAHTELRTWSERLASDVDQLEKATGLGRRRLEVVGAIVVERRPAADEWSPMQAELGRCIRASRLGMVLADEGAQLAIVRRTLRHCEQIAAVMRINANGISQNPLRRRTDRYAGTRRR